MMNFQLDRQPLQQQIEHLKVGKGHVSDLYKRSKPANREHDQELSYNLFIIFE